MSKILITGATGRLGVKVVEMLSRSVDTEIYLLGRDKHRMEGCFSNIDFPIFFDLDDLVKKRVPFSEIDVLLHCAFARTQDGEAIARSLEFSRSVFENACGLGVKSIVNVSSQSVYGVFRENPSKENDAVSPSDAYAVAKYADELLLGSIASAAGIKFTNIRVASLIGEGMDERVVTKLIRQAVEANPLIIEGGEQVYSFMNIEDAADGLVKLLKSSPELWEDVYNLGVSEDYTLNNIAGRVIKLVYSVLGYAGEVHLIPKAVRYKAVLDVSRFNKEFSWQAKISLDESICRIIKCSI